MPVRPSGIGKFIARPYRGAMITGSHVIIYSNDAEADRAFFQDVLKYPHVDAGGGWLIFKLPPGEVAVHPTEGQQSHELYLMCDDINATVDHLKSNGVNCGEVSDEGWGTADQHPASRRRRTRPVRTAAPTGD